MSNAKYLCLIGIVSILSACGGGNNGTPAAPAASTQIPVPTSVSEALPGYKISVFAQAPGTLQIDDLLLHNNNVYALAEDPNNNADGTIVAGTSPQSEVIAYDLNGNVVKTYKVPGHPD